MKAFLVLLFPVMLMAGFRSNMPSDNNSGASQLSDSLPVNILVVNSFDAMSIKARDSKKDLFRVLTDSLTNYLARSILNRTGYKTLIEPGILVKSDDIDSLVFSLMKERNADKCILIVSLDAHFDETGSSEERDMEDGKIRTITSFDICATNDYVLYERNKILRQSMVKSCKPFTTRKVKGRFGLGFGPDIVGKKKHTYGIVERNADDYISQILTGLK